MKSYSCKVENVLSGEAVEQIIEADNAEKAWEKFFRRKWVRETVMYGNSLALDDTPCPMTFSLKRIP